MNLWRDIPAGDAPPNLVNMVVEVISGSRDKYEYHRGWEVFVLDRVLHSSVVFPVEYGFIPQTWSEDGDPLDIMALSYEPAEVGCVIRGEAHRRPHHGGRSGGRLQGPICAGERPKVRWL